MCPKAPAGYCADVVVSSRKSRSGPPDSWAVLCFCVVSDAAAVPLYSGRSARPQEVGVTREERVGRERLLDAHESELVESGQLVGIGDRVAPVGVGGGWPDDILVLLGFSGRGDKDLAALERFGDVEPWAGPV